MKAKRLLTVCGAAVLLVLGVLIGRLSLLSGGVLLRADGLTRAELPRLEGMAAVCERVEPRLDLNTASAEQLEELPGIGPALAQRIVEYRTEYGNFASVDELAAVNGIGEATLTAVRDYLTVG